MTVPEIIWWERLRDTAGLDPMVAHDAAGRRAAAGRHAADRPGADQFDDLADQPADPAARTPTTAGICCGPRATMPRRAAPARTWRSGTPAASRSRSACSRSRFSASGVSSPLRKSRRRQDLRPSPGLHRRSHAAEGRAGCPRPSSCRGACGDQAPRRCN